MGISVIFVSGSTWQQLVGEGYRTRQGALLTAFAKTGKFNRLYIVVETGYRGGSGVRKLSLNELPCEIIEISIPNRFPQSMLRILRIKKPNLFHKFPSNILKMLQDDQVEFVWSYSAALGAFISSKISCPFLYDVVDFRVNDPNLSHLSRFLYKREIELGCCLADVVTCNGEITYQLLNPIVKNNCVLVRNGVEIERFSSLEEDIRNGVGFVGVLSLWTDFSLIEYLLKQFPNVSFKFHGIVHHVQTQLNHLMNYSNFHWNGPISPSDVPKFLASCQVGIIPYDPIKTGRTIGDAMKIFEYLAAGLSVVCTRFQVGLEQKFEGLIKIADDYTGFRNELQVCLSNDVDVNWQKTAWKFVMENSWQKRVQQIISVANQVSTNPDRVEINAG